MNTLIKFSSLFAMNCRSFDLFYCRFYSLIVFVVLNPSWKKMLFKSSSKCNLMNKPNARGFLFLSWFMHHDPATFYMTILNFYINKFP